MSEHDDKQLNDELATLRDQYSSLPRQTPGAEVDAGIRAAAEREVRHRYKPAWGAAAGLAACIGLAVVLVPALLIEAPHDAARPTATELVLVAERRAAEAEVRQKQREAMAMRSSPAPSPPAPQAVEGKGEISLAHEEWLAREELAPTEPPAAMAAPERKRQLLLPDSGKAETAPVNKAKLEALREKLADADETTWQQHLLALRADGDTAIAEILLVDFRERFQKSAAFTLDDLKQMERKPNNE